MRWRSPSWHVSGKGIPVKGHRVKHTRPWGRSLPASPRSSRAATVNNGEKYGWGQGGVGQMTWPVQAMMKTADCILKCDGEAFERRWILSFFFSFLFCIFKGTLAAGCTDQEKQKWKQGDHLEALAISQARGGVALNLVVVTDIMRNAEFRIYSDGLLMDWVSV